VPRHDQQLNVNVHVEDHRPEPERRDDRRRDEPDLRGRPGDRKPGDGDAGRDRGGAGRDGGGKDARNDKALRDSAANGTGLRDARGVREAAEARTPDPRPRDRAGSGWGGSGGQKNGKRPAQGPGGKREGKPQFDLVKTRTWFTAQHESDADTKSWSTTEENSHTVTNSTSRTDGVSVGDEITYELVYDHKVQPETLMALPEDQMLAPHIVEAAAGAGKAVTPGQAAGSAVPAGKPERPVVEKPVVEKPVVEKAVAESKMVALVIDPAVVGTDAVASVLPHEIPAFEPPPPAISAHVPDYERVARPSAIPQ
jgi:hypothetical protein